MQAEWQLQEAKSKLSEVIKEAAHDPQVITVHGVKKAVVLSFEDYKKITRPACSLVEFFQKSPLAKINIEFSRDKDPGRKVKL